MYWYNAGDTVQIAQGRELNAHLSTICDRVFHRSQSSATNSSTNASSLTPPREREEC